MRQRLTTGRRVLGVDVARALAVAAKVVSSTLLDAAGGVERLQGSVPSHPSYSFLRADLDRLLSSGLFGTTPITDWRWRLISAPHSSTTWDLLHTSATAAVVLGLCLLVTRHAPRWLYVPLAATLVRAVDADGPWSAAVPSRGSRPRWTGLVLDRDVNAARNLAVLGEAMVAGSGPETVNGRGGVRVLALPVKRQPGTAQAGSTGTVLPRAGLRSESLLMLIDLQRR